MSSERAVDPIIVLGAPRSGTTYLRTIIDTHRDVCLTHETRVFEWLYRAIEVVPTDVRAVNTRRDEFQAFLRERLPEEIREFYRRHAPEALYWGDKNPHYAEDPKTMALIHELFPGTRFLHIVRDPRDVVASLLKKRQPDGSPWMILDQAHVLVVQHIQNASAFGRSLPPDLYLELRYEDLIADDVGRGRDIFTFLGIEFSAEVEAFCRQQTVERTPLSGPVRDLAKTGEPSGWWSVVPPDQQEQSLNFLAPTLLAYGYETPDSLDALMRRVNDPE